MSETRIPNPLPPEGFNIPLRASFTGMKDAPLIALGHNSINPMMRLHEDGFECRVFWKRKRSYADIERVDMHQSFGTNNLIVVWKEGWFAFIGNVKDKNYLPELVRFFQNKNVPLGESAKKMVK